MIERGEIRSYLPSIAGRERATCLTGSKVLVVSSAIANESLPTALTVPVVSDTSDIPAHMLPLAVPFSDLDPVGGIALIYRPLVIYHRWFTESEGVVSRATMRQVFAAFVGYIDT